MSDTYVYQSQYMPIKKQMSEPTSSRFLAFTEHTL